MKSCSDCGQTKAYTDFVPKASCVDGYEVRCRQCRATRYNKADPDRVFRCIYNAQITSSKGRGHTPPSYTLDQLIAWADQQPQILKIWTDYVASGYQTDLKPSVDRIEEHLPYRLNNIQLMTWGENRQKGADGKRIGTVNARQRPVEAHSIDGRHYYKYISTIEAARQVGGNTAGIINVANGVPIKDSRGYMYQPKAYKGLIWRWI